MKSDAKPGSGIYQIRNLINDKRYIGKSTNLPQRAIRHRYLLNSGSHYNQHLQRSYSKNGPDVFVFEVIEYCEQSILPDREQFWIESLEEDMCYNQDLEVADKRHDKNPFYGKKHTEETRQKMAEAKRGMYMGAENPNYNNRWSESQKDRMRGSRNTNAKLDETKVREIKRLLAEGGKHKDIAEMFGVARTVITRINSGARWAHIGV